MAEVFFGMDEVLRYSEPGDRSNPCLAVDLAMLGVGSIDKSHELLVTAGISTPDGISTVPDDGVELDVNGNRVTIGSTQMFFDLNELASDSRSQFDRGEGAILLVKLAEDDPGDDGMHLILLGGHYRERDTVTKVAVGDSLFDGVQFQSPEDLDDRLGKTLSHNGALFSYHVRVDYA